jgi:hypothetical protein
MPVTPDPARLEDVGSSRASARTDRHRSHEIPPMHTFPIATIQLTAPAMPGMIAGLLIIGFLAVVVGIATYLVVRHVRATQARQAIERARELDELAEIARGRLRAVRAHAAAQPRAADQSKPVVSTRKGAAAR